MNKLRDARKNANFTIEEAAKILGIPGGYLSQIEHNERTVSEERATQIARLYKCNIEDVFLPKRYASREVKQN